MRFRIRFAQQIVGLFIILALVSLAVILILMGVNQRWFAKNYVFQTLFQTADGLSNGMSIKLRGFEIGKVSQIALNSNNRVDVTIEIYSEYYEKVKPRSVLELASSPIGLGGGLNFLPGRNDLPPIQEFSFIPSTDTIQGTGLIKDGQVDRPGGNEAINGIIAQVEPLLAELRITAQNTNAILANVNQAIEGKGDNQVVALLRQVNSTIGDVRNTLGTVDGIMGTVNTVIKDTSTQTSTLLDNVNNITGSLAVTASNLKDPTGLVPKLLDPDGRIFGEVNKILTEVETSVKQLNDLLAFFNKSTPQISGILEDSKAAIKQTTDVLEGVKNNPLLKGGITEQKVQPSTFKSFREEDE